MEKINLISKAQELVAHYTTVKKLSQKKLAAKIGVSDAVLTFIKKGQDENLSDEILQKVISALKQNNDFNIIRTSNYDTIHEVCQRSQAHCLLNAIIGYTGAGKTTGLYDYYLSTTNVFYIKCKNSMNRRQLLQAILAEMGTNYTGSVYEMVNQISEQLNSRKHSLLIIDEAGKVSTNVLLDLHDIREATMYNAGIVMAGCEYFQRNMETAASKEKIGYPEFYSRVSNWNELNKPTKAEIRAICQSNGVLDDEVIKELSRTANYRLLYNAIQSERGIM